MSAGPVPNQSAPVTVVALDGAGGGAPVTGDPKESMPTPQAGSWIHINFSSSPGADWLKRHAFSPI